MPLSAKCSQEKWNEAYSDGEKLCHCYQLLLTNPMSSYRIPMLLSNKETSNSFVLPESRTQKTCGSELKVKRKSSTETIAQFHLYLFYTQNKQRKEWRKKRRWMKYEVRSLSCRFVFLTETNWTPFTPHLSHISRKKGEHYKRWSHSRRKKGKRERSKGTTGRK